jgi:energy-coupling factor transporter ATP-binding protein EcfA2
MLNRLTINNFRGLSSVTLDDLGRVNIFIGENGVGKTTILEALPLIGNPTNPFIVQNIAAARDFPPITSANEEGLGTIFHDANLDEGPRFGFWVDGHEERLEISAELGLPANTPPLSSTVSPFALSDPAMTLGQSFLPGVTIWDFGHPSLSVMIDFIRMMRSA